MVSESASASCHKTIANSSVQEQAGIPQQRQPLLGLRRLMASQLRLATISSWAVPLIAFSIFLLARPYKGIVQDAHIYMGRALADLDPNGVGRDLMFTHDGQFGFSLFRFVAEAMVGILGPAVAAKALAVMAALAWFFAAFTLARQFARGAAAWSAVVFVVLLPASYGATYPFQFAELIAIPRPFAEALVLAGLAALAARHDALCLLCLAAAALLHPIMALAGFGVFVAVRGLEDKRWFLACGIGIAVAITGSFLGLPILDRLITVIDPSLRSLHESRSPFLFPSRWPPESFPPLIVQTVTIAIAAHLRQGRVRWILAATILVGLGGIPTAAIFGDWLSSLLIVQAQTWRAAWLMSLLGAMSLSICAVELWPQGLSGRLVLAFLALGWSFNTQLWVAVPAAILTVYLYFFPGRLDPLLKPQYVRGIWAFTVLVGVAWNLHVYAYVWHFAAAAPAGYRNLGPVWLRGFLPFPICALAVYLAIIRPRISRLLQNGFMLLLFAAAVWFWDHRPPAQRMMEGIQPPPEIMQLIDQRKGEVLWIDGSAEAWFLLHRPQWVSPLQGGPIIFSPVLAAEWRSRMQFLTELHLADQKSFAPWSDPKSTDRPRLSEEAVRALCTRDGAPAWIIAPLEYGTEPPAGVEMKLWRLPEPIFQLMKGDDDYVWRRIDVYGIIPCAGRQTQ